MSSGGGAQAVQSLDWQRMFLGDYDLLFYVEIVIRTLIILVWLLVLLRVAGKRGVAQLSPLELAIVIGLGSAVGDAMFYAEVPLVHAMLVMALVVGFQRLVAHLIISQEKVETFLEGTPVELVRDGVMQLGGLKRSALSYEDLFERLRPEGVRQLGQVQRAYFEQDGQLSVFCHPEGKAPPGLPIVPPWDLEVPAPPPDHYAGLLACLRCGRIHEQSAEEMPVPCGCGGTAWTPAVLDSLGGDAGQDKSRDKGGD